MPSLRIGELKAAKWWSHKRCTVNHQANGNCSWEAKQWQLFPIQTGKDGKIKYNAHCWWDSREMGTLMSGVWSGLGLLEWNLGTGIKALKICMLEPAWDTEGFCRGLVVAWVPETSRPRRLSIRDSCDGCETGYIQRRQIQKGRVLGIMEAKFLTVREGSYKYGKGEN